MKLDVMQQQTVNLLCDHAPVALLVNLLVPVLVCIPLAHEVPASILLMWCAAVAVVALVRFSLLWAYHEFCKEEKQANLWQKLYFSCTLLQGMVWGLGAVVLLNNTTGFNQMLVLLVIAGISAGAIPLLGAVITAYTWFLLSAAVPVIVWLLWTAQSQYWVLAGIGGLFTWVCFIGAKRFNDVLIRTASSVDDHAELVDDLNSTNEELEGNVRHQQQIQQDLRDRANLEQVITTLSAGFVRLTVDQIENGIDRALAKLGSFARTDRAYIYLFDDRKSAGDITHQWYTPEAGSRSAQGFDQFGYITASIKKARAVTIESISMLPTEAAAERDMFTSNGLKSWFCVPLVMDGEVLGFLGFDAIEREVRLSQEVIGLLRVAGTTLINALERKRVEGMMQHQAYHDPLTALPNRRLFMEHIERTYENCRRTRGKAALLFLDIDYFKTVNDTLGHSGGDLLLKQIADRLKEGLRGEDIASRMGGDEFVVLLSDATRDSVDPIKSTLSLAQRLQSILRVPYVINGQEVNITVSMGVALFPAGEKNAASIISNADSAMYRVKKAGRNAIRFFEQDTQRRARLQLQSQEDLREAIDRGEFIFYAQSQVNLHGDIVTDELLLRWNSPAGLIPPDKFLPLAEETGLITDIDEWVVNNACQLIQQQKNNDLEQNISYAINVSTAQFKKRGFEALVANALESAGLNGGFLEFEINENVLQENQEEMAKKMRRLKSIGVRIAIDDFGMGHSSLAFLKQLPVDKIKIDRSFVQGIEEEADNTAIVEAMLSIAQHFELEVVAEGVENEVQLEFLKNHGVGLFQGHYFGEPRRILFNDDKQRSRVAVG